MDRPKREKREKDNRNSEFEERVVEISRVSRVVKGGRRIRFRVLVVIGDRKGKIGYGIAKGNEIAVAVKKAVASAKKRMINVPIINETIPYEITQELGSARVFLKPARQGTSVVAGGVVRVIADLAGIKNLLSKTIGTANKVNNVKTVFLALSSFDPIKVEIIKKRFEKYQKVETTQTIDTELDSKKSSLPEDNSRPKADQPVVEKKLVKPKVKKESKIKSS